MKYHTPDVMNRLSPALTNDLWHENKEGDKDYGKYKDQDANTKTNPLEKNMKKERWHRQGKVKKKILTKVKTMHKLGRVSQSEWVGLDTNKYKYLGYEIRRGDKYKYEYICNDQVRTKNTNTNPPGTWRQGEEGYQ